MQLGFQQIKTLSILSVDNKDVNCKQWIMLAYKVILEPYEDML